MSKDRKTAISEMIARFDLYKTEAGIIPVHLSLLIISTASIRGQLRRWVDSQEPSQAFLAAVEAFKVEANNLSDGFRKIVETAISARANPSVDSLEYLQRDLQALASDVYHFKWTIPHLLITALGINYTVLESVTQVSNDINCCVRAIETEGVTGCSFMEDASFGAKRLSQEREKLRIIISGIIDHLNRYLTNKSEGYSGTPRQRTDALLARIHQLPTEQGKFVKEYLRWTATGFHTFHGRIEDVLRALSQGREHYRQDFTALTGITTQQLGLLKERYSQREKAADELEAFSQLGGVRAPGLTGIEARYWRDQINQLSALIQAQVSDSLLWAQSQPMYQGLDPTAL